MTKKLLSFFISVVLVLTCMAFPAMATDATENEIVLTLNSEYFLDNESLGGNSSNMTTSSSTYKTFQFNITEGYDGDYDMKIGIKPYSSDIAVMPRFEISLDDILLDTWDVDGFVDSGKGYYQPYKTIGLSQGTHKIMVKCISGNPYFNNITLTRVGAQTKTAYGYKFKSGNLQKYDEDGNAVYEEDGTTPVRVIRPGTKAEGNDAVFVSENGSGQYSNLYSNGWAQFELPTIYNGWYKLSVYIGGNNAKTVSASLSDTLGTKGREVAEASHTFGSSDYSTASKYKWLDLGTVYIDGTEKYVAIQAKDCDDVRLFQVKLTPFELSALDGFNTLATNLTNPDDNNNNGDPYGGMSGNGTLKFEGIKVTEYGDYRLKVNMSLNDGAAEGSTITAKVDGKAAATVPVISTDPDTYAEVDLGVVSFPANGTHTLELEVNATDIVRVYSLTMERLKAGEYTNFTMKTDGNQYVIFTDSNYAAFDNAFGNNTNFAQNRWAVYKVNAARAGRYKVVAETAADVSTASLKLYVNGIARSQKYDYSAGTLSVPASGYTQTPAKDMTWYIDLNEGINTLYFNCTGGDVRFLSFNIATVIQPAITDASGSEVKTLGTRNNDTFIVSVPLDSAEKLTVITALYKDGNVVKADVAETVGANLVAELSGITIADADNCELKVFYLNSINYLAPICSYYVVR